MHRTNSVDEVLGSDVLQKEAARAGMERVVDMLIEI
jgi:hypothetical protein